MRPKEGDPMSSSNEVHLPVLAAEGAQVREGEAAEACALPNESPAAALSRRSFLRSAVGSVGVASAAMATGCNSEFMEGLFRAHFKELTRDDLKKIIARM